AEGPLRVEAQQFGGVAAEDGDFIVIAEARRVENEVDRRFRPGIGEIGSHHELTCADLCHEVANAFGTKHHGVVVEGLQVFGRRIFDAAVRTTRTQVWPRRAALIKTAGVGWQVATGVRGADLKRGVAVERALENEVRERNGRLQRVADYI